MNVRSRKKLELSILQPSLLRTAGPTPYLEKYSRKLENHAIINNVVDEIQMTEPKKVSAVNYEAPELLEIDCDENDLY